MKNYLKRSEWYWAISKEVFENNFEIFLWWINYYSDNLLWNLWNPTNSRFCWALFPLRCWYESFASSKYALFLGRSTFISIAWPLSWGSSAFSSCANILYSASYSFGLLDGALASMIFLRNKLPSLLHSKNM